MPCTISPKPGRSVYFFVVGAFLLRVRGAFFFAVGARRAFFSCCGCSGRQAASE